MKISSTIAGSRAIQSFLLIAGLALATVQGKAQSTTLPLHKFDLKASLQRNVVNLIWTTENESNTSRFLIQRSTDGFHYTTVGTKPASGQTNTTTEYRSTDEIPMLIQSHIVYYRIRAEDVIDNRFTYSNIVPVKLDIASEIKIWPNPFQDDLRITFMAKASTTVDAYVYNIIGNIACQNVFTMLKGLNQVSVKGSGKLPSGLYIIRLVDRSSGFNYTQQLIK